MKQIHTGIMADIEHGCYEKIVKGGCYVGELPANKAVFQDAVELKNYINSNNLKKGISHYRPWQDGEKVRAGQVRSYENGLYECIQSHTTQSDWTPDLTPALWKVYEEGIPEWTQPVGSHDVYPLHYIVKHEGKLYRSLHATNSWIPGTDDTLWELLSEEEEEIKEWDAHTLYHTGDKVIFEGYIWESLIDNNSWSPSGYPQGWERQGEALATSDIKTIQTDYEFEALTTSDDLKLLIDEQGWADKIDKRGSADTLKKKIRHHLRRLK